MKFKRALLLTLTLGLLLTAMLANVSPSTSNNFLAQGNPTQQPTVTDVNLQAASERPIDFSGESNDEWQPIEHDFDGVLMVLAPPGCFMMGSETNRFDERPIHEQCFDEPFWIDKFEVTNAQYTAFEGVAAREGYRTVEALPRESITWFEAHDFCARRGAQANAAVRLPTEAEWEYAARGPDSLIFPWGNAFVAENVVYSANSEGQPAAVGSRPGGASWVGALDMSGNLREWTSSLFQPYPYQPGDGRERDTGNSRDVLRVLRGGSMRSVTYELRAATRGRSSPAFSNFSNGFRCVRDFQ
jgi:formylglycine-generating enzyme required for sulfatase activity